MDAAVMQELDRGAEDGLTECTGGSVGGSDHGSASEDTAAASSSIPADVQPGKRRGGGGAKTGGVAVSYTHLRAHETEADL
eukprot:3011020-Rhodomonas_salina.1